MTSETDALKAFDEVGGPAFPCEWPLPGQASLTCAGMTQRAFIATNILSGMNAVLVNTADWPSENAAKRMAENAVEQADALLAALKARSAP